MARTFVPPSTRAAARARSRARGIACTTVAGHGAARLGRGVAGDRCRARLRARSERGSTSVGSAAEADDADDEGAEDEVERHFPADRRQRRRAVGPARRGDGNGRGDETA